MNFEFKSKPTYKKTLTVPEEERTRLKNFSSWWSFSGPSFDLRLWRRFQIEFHLRRWRWTSGPSASPRRCRSSFPDRCSKLEVRTARSPWCRRAQWRRLSSRLGIRMRTRPRRRRHSNCGRIGDLVCALLLPEAKETDYFKEKNCLHDEKFKSHEN